MASTGIISLRGMEFYAFHGVMAQERELGTRYHVDVTVEYPVNDEAWKNDDLTGTLNYAEIAEITHHVMLQPSKLLENVAFRLKSALLKAFPEILAGEITITKLTPPVPEIMQGAAVTLKF